MQPSVTFASCEFARPSVGADRPRSVSSSEFDSCRLDLHSATWGGAHDSDRFFDRPVALGVGGLSIPSWYPAEAFGDVEGGLVLGESSGGVVPGSG